MTTCRLEKLELLAQGAIFDLTCADDSTHPGNIAKKRDFAAGNKIDNIACRISSLAPEQESMQIPGVSHVNNCGRPMPVLKVLQTSHCQFNCKYCGFRKDSDFPRESLTSEELANTTFEMSNAGIIEGLFLSSGIGDTVRGTMTNIIDTARILRQRHKFEGYIHLKILPGSTVDLIEAAGQFADRLSINMEAPTESALKDMAPNKSIQKAIIDQMQTIETLRRKGRIPRRVGQTTQFVVGGSDDPGANDRALVVATEYLYRELNFRRVYYSPFNPVIGTPLQDRPAENPRRSHRLYQADRLLALYGFKLDDFIFNDSGRLDLDTDPKELWADAHPEIFPVEITRCEKEQLMRVPGIGPLLAKRIMEARFTGGLKSVDDLNKIGRVAKKIYKYILVNGRKGEIEKGSVTKGIEEKQLVLPFGG
jgi:predicted DNA-binding helix-hairpin-helix protein